MKKHRNYVNGLKYFPRDKSVNGITSFLAISKENIDVQKVIVEVVLKANDVMI